MENPTAYNILTLVDNLLSLDFSLFSRVEYDFLYTFLNSEQSNECIEFTIMFFFAVEDIFYSRKKSLILNFNFFLVV